MKPIEITSNNGSEDSINSLKADTNKHSDLLKFAGGAYAPQFSDDSANSKTNLQISELANSTTQDKANQAYDKHLVLAKQTGGKRKRKTRNKRKTKNKSKRKTRNKRKTKNKRKLKTRNKRKL